MRQHEHGVLIREAHLKELLPHRNTTLEGEMTRIVRVAARGGAIKRHGIERLFKSAQIRHTLLGVLSRIVRVEQRLAVPLDDVHHGRGGGIVIRPQGGYGRWPV